MDLSTLRTERARAERVALLLQDEDLIEVFSTLEKEAIHAWRSSEDANSTVALNAWHRLRALDSVKATLESIVTTGRMAAQQLERAADDTTCKAAKDLNNRA